MGRCVLVNDYFYDDSQLCISHYMPLLIKAWKCWSYILLRYAWILFSIGSWHLCATNHLNQHSLVWLWQTNALHGLSPSKTSWSYLRIGTNLVPPWNIAQLCPWTCLFPRVKIHASRWPLMLVYPIQMGMRIFRADALVCTERLGDAYPSHIRVPHSVRVAVSHSTFDRRSSCSLGTLALLLHSHSLRDVLIHSAISWCLYGRMGIFVVLNIADIPWNAASYFHMWKLLRTNKDKWTHTCWEHCAPALIPSSPRIPVCIRDRHCREWAIVVSMVDRWELHSQRMTWSPPTRLYRSRRRTAGVPFWTRVSHCR